MSRDAFAMLIVTVLAVSSVQADGFVLGDERLSVVFSEQTGWPDEVGVEGLTVLRPSKAPPFEVNVPFIDRQRTNGVWRTGVRPLGVTRLDERTAKTSVVAGP